MVKGLFPYHLKIIQLIQDKLEFLARHGMPSYQGVAISPSREPNCGHHVFSSTAV
jgi:hypothetical protein